MYIDLLRGGIKMTAFMIGIGVFAWGMGAGALLHETDLLKIHVVRKLGKK